VLTAGLTLLAAGCGRLPASAESAAPAEPSASRLERVVAGPPRRKTLTLTSVQPASIEPYEQTPLYPKLAGYVDEVLVDIGDRVTKDQPLVRLWVPELLDERAQKEALVAQAEAERAQAKAAVVAAEAVAKTAQARLAGAQAGVVRAEGEHARWKAESDRISQLVASGVVTPKLADETLNQLRAAEAALAEAQAAIGAVQAEIDEARAKVLKAEADESAAAARVRVAQADLARTVTLLQYCEIKAPFAGVVTTRNVDTRHYVHPAGGDSSPLLIVASRDRVRVFAAIPETEAGLVSADPEQPDPVVVTVPALGHRSFEGHVTRTSWTLDPTNRSLNVEIDLDNPDDLLRPGMYATLTIRLAEIPGALTVPAAAIVREGNATYCCCVVDGGVIERRPVQLGLRAYDEIEVRSGLSDGDVVVLARAAGLQPGQRVEVIAPAPK
jgi:RND family efflux transporter MFP subunit